VDAGEYFHLAVITFMFLTFFTYLMLPPPLDRVASLTHGVGYTGVKAAMWLGLTSDYRICGIMDLWNYGGMDANVSLMAPVLGGPETEIMSCALLSENNVTLGRYEEEEMGAYTYGTAISFEVTNPVQINKIFYSFYAFLGLVIAAVLGDVFVTFAMFRTGTTKALAFGGTASVALTMLIMRATTFWDGMLTALASFPFGRGALSSIIALLFVGAPAWWVVMQVMAGYRIGKEGVVNKFKAIETATRADVERGRAALNAGRGRK